MGAAVGEAEGGEEGPKNAEGYRESMAKTSGGRSEPSIRNHERLGTQNEHPKFIQNRLPKNGSGPRVFSK